MQKLLEQKEILLGKDLKDLGLPGVLEKKIIVVGCPAATNLLDSHVNLIKVRSQGSSLVYFSNNILLFFCTQRLQFYKILSKKSST